MEDQKFTLLDLAAIGKLSYRTKELTNSEKNVLVEMSHLCRNGYQFFQQTKTFADDIGMHHRQLQNTIKSLSEKGFIQHKCYNPSRKVHVYILTFKIGDTCLIPLHSSKEILQNATSETTHTEHCTTNDSFATERTIHSFTDENRTNDSFVLINKRIGDNSYIITKDEKNNKKNSDELFFATKIPDDISDYVSKNLMMVSDEQKLKSQLIYDGKYSVIYQILAIKKEANLVHLKPYMELIPDDVLHNFSQTLVYAFNNSKSLKHKQDIIKFAIHLLYDNNSQIPLQSAMGLKLNFTELSMSKFSGLRVSEGMDVRNRMAEVNSQLKTIDRYLDFPSAMIAYWSHGRTMERKNKFANA
jgi:hypothetical protein